MLKKFVYKLFYFNKIIKFIIIYILINNSSLVNDGYI